MRMTIEVTVVATALIGALSAMFLMWNRAQGFIPWQGEWWGWLARSIAYYRGMPDGMLWPGIGFCLALATIGVSSTMWFQRPSIRSMWGGVDPEKAHGSARWALMRDIRRAGLLAVNGVTVGAFGRKALRHNGPEHVLAFAPTRSGKGVSLVLPTLLEWRHSAVVLDIKGENYALTAGYRKSLGHRILRFEPTAMEGSVRFNPLAEIRLWTDYELMDCQNIAAMIIDPDGKGLRDFWMQSGFEWLSAAILHVLYRIRSEGDRTATLSDVNRILSAVEFASKPPPDDSGGEEGNADTKAPEAVEGYTPNEQSGPIPKDPNGHGAKGEADPVGKLLDSMIEYDHGRESVNSEVRRVAAKMKGRAREECSGVHSSSLTQLSLYADPIIARNIEISDFRLDDLMNGDRPVALYIVIPPSDIDRLRPLVRVIFNVMLRRLTAGMEFEDGRSVESYRHRLLLMLDEFTSIGKLEIFEKALAFMAGYGLKCFVIVQDLAQLQQAYGREESIMSNCHIRIAFAPNKVETAKTLSEMLGKQTVIQAKRSRSGRRGSASVSDNLAGTARPLMTPEEIMAMPGAEKNSRGEVVKPGEMLVLAAGFPAVRGEQRLYFKDKKLLDRARVVAPGTPEEIPTVARRPGYRAELAARILNPEPTSKSDRRIIAGGGNDHEPTA